MHLYMSIPFCREEIKIVQCPEDRNNSERLDTGRPFKYNIVQHTTMPARSEPICM